MRDSAVISRLLLAWYDRCGRDLPWRSRPGQARADPYHVWLSEIMLQQTTVAAVKGYFSRFVARWPTVEALAAADDGEVMAEWAGLGYYARARNLLACARLVVQRGGFPTERAGLQSLPGIGPYTSAAIAAIAYDLPEPVVDGNVERVLARLFAVQTPLPEAKPIINQFAAQLTPQHRPGDYAQAVMDLGATVCTPRNPSCARCPLEAHCQAKAEGIAADLPRKRPRPPKPQRSGVVWIGRQGESLLMERRAPQGLLGGTLGFPSSGWDGSDLPAPAGAPWRQVGTVHHVFTHFSLDLQVMTALISRRSNRGELVPLTAFRADDLTGLMRKAWDMAQPVLKL